MSHRISEELYIYQYSTMEKKVKNISKESQLVDGEEIKAWAVFQTRHWKTLITSYGDLFELVEDGKEEKVEENEEKPAKKSKK